MEQSGQPIRNAWSLIRRSPIGLVGAVMLLISLVTAILAPVIAPYDPNATVRVTINDIYTPPQLEHFLGTDDAGKDVLTNFIYGSRVSLTVGFFASFIAVFIGAVSRCAGRRCQHEPALLCAGNRVTGKVKDNAAGQLMLNREGRDPPPGKQSRMRESIGNALRFAVRSR